MNPAADPDITVVARQAHEAFTERFGGEPDGLWTAPGRVNLIGEHTDYNGGLALPMAIDRCTVLAVRRRRDGGGEAIVRSLQKPDEEVRVSVGALRAHGVDGWAALPLGVAWAMGLNGLQIGGFELLAAGSLPLGGGLSSSAALGCGTALALCDLFGLGDDGTADLRTALALIAQRAENEMAGSGTGVMDQMAILHGRADHAVLLDMRAMTAEQVPVGLQEAGLALLVIDTGVVHEHATGGYADRRRGCEDAAKRLGIATLREATRELLAERQAELDEERRRLVRHVVEENGRVERTVELLRTPASEGGGPSAIGPLLDASHASLRDLFRVSCPELDVAVDAARAGGAIGARMTGGGFGGSAIALVPVAAVERVTDSVGRAFAERDWREPGTFTVQASAGARRIG